MNAPASFALNWYTIDSPGLIDFISTFHATLLACRSMECASLPSFTNVMVNRSPTLPRRVGPGTLSSKVHISWVTPGAISRTFSVACMVSLCSVAPSAGFSVGSYGVQSAAGVAWKSIVAPVAVAGWVAGVPDSLFDPPAAVTDCESDRPSAIDARNTPAMAMIAARLHIVQPTGSRRVRPDENASASVALLVSDVGASSLTCDGSMGCGPPCCAKWAVDINTEPHVYEAEGA